MFLLLKFKWTWCSGWNWFRVGIGTSIEVVACIAAVLQVRGLFCSREVVFHFENFTECMFNFMFEINYELLAFFLNNFYFLIKWTGQLLIGSKQHFNNTQNFIANYFENSEHMKNYFNSLIYIFLFIQFELQSKCTAPSFASLIYLLKNNRPLTFIF